MYGSWATVDFCTAGTWGESNGAWGIDERTCPSVSILLLSVEKVLDNAVMSFVLKVKNDLISEQECFIKFKTRA